MEKGEARNEGGGRAWSPRDGKKERWGRKRGGKNRKRKRSEHRQRWCLTLN